MENRDFKGVWISKEIWLNKELSAIDKVILTEIDSLDNENGCWASNEYLAEFCGVSVPTITRSISKLKNLGYIETEMSDGRHRVIKMIRVSNQNDEGVSSKRLASNIYNNKDNNSILSKDNISEAEDDYTSHSYSKDDFLGSAKRKVKPKSCRKSLYDQCLDENILFSQDLKLTVLLNKYLVLRLAMKDKPLYGVNQWKGLLSKLADIVKDNPGMSYEEIVSQSIERGYASFFPVNKSSYKKKDVFAEGDGLSCEQSEETEEQRKEKLEKTGRRSEF